MANIKILDCTLRDGGYINEWQFGYQNIKSILNRLAKADIDIVECGFLEDSEYSEDYSFFSNVDQIEKFLPLDKRPTQYVAMTRYGHLDITRLKEYDGKSIEGIRVTFHENEAEEAIEYCRQIQDKGYKVYVQPVGTTSYTDSYLLKIIEIVNSIKPYAFYIVDTLGLMKKNDLLRLFYLVDNNLHKDIIIGFHSHNNLQLSFSNAQELAELHTNRSIIVDSSVYGMGRGAGNLNTELITQHLNSLKNTNYSTEYLLEIIDETIIPLSEKYSWGYSVPYYLAAINNCHPNYATYLMNRKTLPVKSIGNILNMITQDKRELYNEQYIFDLYQQYQRHYINDSEDIKALRELFRKRSLLILAPGSSINRQLNDVISYIHQNETIVISVNFDGDEIRPHFCFFSNDKRYQNFKISQVHSQDKSNLIVTSNIQVSEGDYRYKVNYSDFVNSQPIVNDNATLMLIALLIKLQIKHVAIAGFDGFSWNAVENYAEDDLETSLDKELMAEMNRQITEVVQEYSHKINMEFITDSLYKR